MKDITVQQAHGAICEVEQRHDLLRYLVDGWRAWAVVRFAVSHAFLEVPADPSRAISRLRRLPFAARDLLSLAGTRRKRNLVLTYSSGLLERGEEGRYRDIWFDDIDALRSGTFRVERLNNRRFLGRRRQALVPADATSSLIDICTSAMVRRTPPRELADAARAISHAVRAELGLEIATEQWIAIRLRYFYWAKRMWSGLLRRVSATAVVVADPGEYALIAAAKEQKVRTIELQHGITDHHHPAYGWTHYAVPFKSTMPVPDRILLYGEHWLREMRPEMFWGDDLRVVGSPRIDRYRAQRDSGRGVGPIRVLVTAQGFAGNETADFLRAVLETVKDAEITIKLHPIYATEEEIFRQLLRSDARVVILRAEDGPSTFELLTTADIHLSISSASHYDSLGLRTPTVVLGLITHDAVRTLYRSGHASFAARPQELAALVQGARDVRVPRDVSDYYFKTDAAANIARELSDAPGTTASAAGLAS